MIARSRGVDYIYSFLKSFYLDPSRPTGVNNLVLPGTSMPHVLWQSAGQSSARSTTAKAMLSTMPFTRSSRDSKWLKPGSLTPEEYDQFVRDTVNFLDYIGEPMQLERRNLGMRVLVFLFVFFLLAYFLKKEYLEGREVTVADGAARADAHCPLSGARRLDDALLQRSRSVEPSHADRSGGEEHSGRNDRRAGRQSARRSA